MAGYTQGSFFTVTPTDDFDFNQYDEVKDSIAEDYNSSVKNQVKDWYRAKYNIREG